MCVFLFVVCSQQPGGKVCGTIEVHKSNAKCDLELWYATPSRGLVCVCLVLLSALPVQATFQPTNVQRVPAADENTTGVCAELVSLPVAFINILLSVWCGTDPRCCR